MPTRALAKRPSTRRLNSRKAGKASSLSTPRRVPRKASRRARPALPKPHRGSRPRRVSRPTGSSSSPRRTSKVSPASRLLIPANSSARPHRSSATRCRRSAQLSPRTRRGLSLPRSSWGSLSLARWCWTRQASSPIRRVASPRWPAARWIRIPPSSSTFLVPPSRSCRWPPRFVHEPIHHQGQHWRAR